MDKRILKYLVKKEYAEWTPMVNAVFEYGKLCIECREKDDVDSMLDKMGDMIDDAIADLRRRIGSLYERVALTNRSRKYVKRRFAKECIPYATFFMRELTFRANMSVIASARYRQRALATANTVKTMVPKLCEYSILDISVDYESIIV